MRAWNRGGVTVMRIVVEVTPEVTVPPPVTASSTVREPALVNAKVAGFVEKGPAGLVESLGTQENVAPGSVSEARKVSA
jgi:hypothetical protein